MAKAKLLICPYCGGTQPADAERCGACSGLFEPLSRQATHNAMGPWFIRDPDRPFQPGCSYETLVRLVQRGRVGPLTVVRGPTTRQFWTVAKRVQGISHLFGYCHECGALAGEADPDCHACGASFGPEADRDRLGLPEIRPLPWEMAGRISVFASNDELLGRAPVGSARRTVAAANGESVASTIEHSLRRRIERQARMIRGLTIAAVIMASLCFVLLVQVAGSPRSAPVGSGGAAVGAVGEWSSPNAQVPADEELDDADSAQRP
jgi:hypothetical protein